MGKPGIPSVVSPANAGIVDTRAEQVTHPDDQPVIGSVGPDRGLQHLSGAGGLGHRADHHRTTVYHHDPAQPLPLDLRRIVRQRRHRHRRRGHRGVHLLSNVLGGDLGNDHQATIGGRGQTLTEPAVDRSLVGDEHVELVFAVLDQAFDPVGHVVVIGDRPRSLLLQFLRTAQPRNRATGIVRVVDQNGDPVEGEPVTLWPPGTVEEEATETHETNADGVVVIELSGFEPTDVASFDVEVRDQEQTLGIMSDVHQGVQEAVFEVDTSDDDGDDSTDDGDRDDGDDTDDSTDDSEKETEKTDGSDNDDEDKEKTDADGDGVAATDDVDDDCAKVS